MDNTSSDDVLLNDTTHIEEIITRHLWTYVGCLIIIIGTLGHFLSITVMATSRSFRIQCSTVYLITMSISGLLPLYTGLLRFVIFIGISGWENDLRDASDAVCRFHMTMTYASLQYFAWLQATIAVDRLISVAVPHKYAMLFSWRIGIVVVVFELLAVVGLNMAVTFTTGFNENGSCAILKQSFFNNVWTYIDLLSFSLVPATILIICNTAILFLLYQRQYRVASDSSSKIARSITVMLMSLNVLFLITTLPISIMALQQFIKWGDYGSKQYALMDLIWSVCSLFQYAGSACTFFVYFVTGSKFREELRQMPSRLCIRIKTTSKSTSNTTNLWLSAPPDTCSFNGGGSKSSIASSR